MPVALLPPTTSSGGEWQGQVPLTEAPRYVRGRGNSRWHRVRSAVVYPDREPYRSGTYYSYWCGPASSEKAGPLWLTDEVPTGEPACGTCVGRALGARQDETPVGLPSLRFDPRWSRPPAKCPASGSATLLTELPGGRCATCLVCGGVYPTRSSGGAYNPRWGIAHHAPGGDLIDGCPFHAWSRLVARDGRATCACGWPGDLNDKTDGTS